MVPPYSLGICPPTTPETLWSPVPPSSRKNSFSEGIFFWQITQMALELPKIDICQNWSRRVLGDVIRCLESKFDKKIPMRSVPNCQKEIPEHHAIRWFKCKLKPPNKNEVRMKLNKERWKLILNKKVPLLENARGIQPALYPVHNVSYQVALVVWESPSWSWPGRKGGE